MSLISPYHLLDLQQTRGSKSRVASQTTDHIDIGSGIDDLPHSSITPLAHFVTGHLSREEISVHALVIREISQ